MSRYAVPCGIIAFCLGTFWLTTQFDRVPPILLRGMQPSDFPQLVLIVIMVLAGLVMLQRAPAASATAAASDGSEAGESEAGEAVTDSEPDLPPVSAHVWRSMGLLLVFIAVAQVDLFLGLGVFAGALTMVWGERRWWALLIVMVIAPLCVFFLFDQVFEIRFPRGLLTELWYG